MLKKYLHLLCFVCVLSLASVAHATGENRCPDIDPAKANTLAKAVAAFNVSLECLKTHNLQVVTKPLDGHILNVAAIDFVIFDVASSPGHHSTAVIRPATGATLGGCTASVSANGDVTGSCDSPATATAFIVYHNN